MEGIPGVDQMSDLEALMWNLEKDPRLSSTMGNVTFFDVEPDIERFRATLERASVVFPRLRQRVSPVFGRLAPPRWELDPHFDLDHHFRTISLGGRGTRSDVDDLVARLITTPFDRRRPLWEFVAVTGLRGGKAAMIQRLHHTITDGQGGLKLSLEFIDFERDAPQRPEVEAPPVTTEESSLLGDVTEAAGHVARRQLGMAHRALTGSLSAITHPGSLVRDARATKDTIMSIARQANVGDHPLSPLWTERSLSRAYRHLDVNLQRTRTAARRFGVSINDIFVAGTLLGAVAYHREFGTDVASLRMAMPISQRTGSSLGGNLFAPSQSVLPGDVKTPAEAISAVHDVLAVTKAAPALAATEALAGAANLLPTSLVTRAGFRITSTIDFVTSNLRAAPFDTYMAGALMESNYPIGPLMGAAFNVTTMSFHGRLNMGVIMDTAAITDPDLLIGCLVDAFRAILAAKP